MPEPSAASVRCPSCTPDWCECAGEPGEHRPAASDREIEVLREMHKVLFGSLAITTEHLSAFDALIRASGRDPKEVYRDA